MTHPETDERSKQAGEWSSLLQSLQQGLEATPADIETNRIAQNHLPETADRWNNLGNGRQVDQMFPGDPEELIRIDGFLQFAQ